MASKLRSPESVLKRWRSLTAVERRVEQWRRARGMSHWCPDGTQPPQRKQGGSDVLRWLHPSRTARQGA